MFTFDQAVITSRQLQMVKSNPHVRDYLLMDEKYRYAQISTNFYFADKVKTVGLCVSFFACTVFRRDNAVTGIFLCINRFLFKNVKSALFVGLLSA